MRMSTAPPSEIHDNVPDADLIFVLAGQEARKIYGLQLFHQRRAQRILLSVGRFEIRNFSRLDIPIPISLMVIAEAIPPPKRHFFVLFEEKEVFAKLVTAGRLGTWSEIAELGKILRARPEIHSLIVVSSPRHLYRVNMCCRELLPVHTRVRRMATPCKDSQCKPFSLWRNPASRKTVFTELIKICVYRILLWARRVKVPEE